MKGDTNIYFKQITFFEKKRFCKNHTYFFLKNIIFFQLSFATFEQPYPVAAFVTKKSLTCTRVFEKFERHGISKFFGA